MMVCPECGSHNLFTDNFGHSYLDNGVVIQIGCFIKSCYDCHHVLEAIEHDTRYWPMPERDYSQRYYIDFEDELWWVCDSRDDMAWDYYTSLEDAQAITDVFNQAEPTDKQE